MSALIEKAASRSNYARMRPPSRAFRLSQLRKVRQCEEVAAVCFRVNGHGFEFLLVQTRGGRWTFPKGGVGPGVTYAQAAAGEAFEEAGVHGRIEESPFTTYWRRGLSVNAYLCEVLHLGPPQESGRNRTWFSPEKAQQRLRQRRSRDDGDEFARVVELAVARILRLGSSILGITPRTDALQRVQFEASRQMHGYAERAAHIRYTRVQRGDAGTAIALALDTRLRKVLQLGPRQELGPPDEQSTINHFPPGLPDGAPAQKSAPSTPSTAKLRILPGRSTPPAPPAGSATGKGSDRQ